MSKSTASRVFLAAMKALLASFCVLTTAFVGMVGYSRYVAAKERQAELEAMLQRLTYFSHPRLNVHTDGFCICTTDRPPIAGEYDFRLVHGTNSVQKFDAGVFKASGRVLTAWVSDWTPRSEMAKFEQFSISYSAEGAHCTLVAKPRLGESITMEFRVTSLVEQAESMRQ